MNKIETIKVLLAVASFLIGCVLVSIGLWMPPLGVVDNSLLIVLGELLTFAASVLGINYTYQFKLHQLNKRIDKLTRDESE